MRLADSHLEALIMGRRMQWAVHALRLAMDTDIDKCCVAVLGAILITMDFETGLARPSYAQLALLTGYSEGAVRKALTVLIERGYLSRGRFAVNGVGVALSHYWLPEVGKGAITAYILERRSILGDTARLTALNSEQLALADCAEYSADRPKLSPPNSEQSGAEFRPDCAPNSADRDLTAPFSALSLRRRLDDDEDRIVAFASLMVGWGVSTPPVVTKKDLAAAKETLTNILVHASAASDDVLNQALDLTLEAAKAAEAHTPGPAPFANYFAKTLETQIKVASKPAADQKRKGQARSRTPLDEIAQQEFERHNREKGRTHG